MVLLSIVFHNLPVVAYASLLKASVTRALSVVSKVRNLGLDPGMWSFWLMEQDLNDSTHSWWKRGGKIDSGYICWFSVHRSLYGVALWIVSHKHILHEGKCTILLSLHSEFDVGSAWGCWDDVGKGCKSHVARWQMSSTWLSHSDSFLSAFSKASSLNFETPAQMLATI